MSGPSTPNELEEREERKHGLNGQRDAINLKEGASENDVLFGVLMHTCSSSTQDAEARGSQDLGIVRSCL